MLDQAQAQAGSTQFPAPGGVHPVKGSENFSDGLRSQTNAGIFNRNQDLVLDFLDLDQDRPTGFVVLNGIFHQVVEGPVEEEVTGIDLDMASL